MISVLHVIGSGMIGGAERFVFALAQCQARNGGGVTPAVLLRYKEGPMSANARRSGLKVDACSERIGLGEFMRIRRMFRQYDVIHFHGLYPSLLLATCTVRVSAVYSIHGARAMTRSAGDVLHAATAGRGWPTWKGLQRFAHRHWLSFFLKHVAALNYAPTEFYKRFYMQNYGLPEDQINVLPLGIDPRAYPVTEDRSSIMASCGIPHGSLVVGTVCTFRRLKRIDRLIDAFALVVHSSARPASVRLLVVGDGEERPKIEAQIKEKRLEGSVFLAGLQSQVADYLNAMDVFVLPSEFENMPLACMEAMLVGLPVIVFGGSGGAEELARQAGGVVVRDVPDLARRLEELFREPADRVDLGRRLRQYALSELTIERTASRLEAAYGFACQLRASAGTGPEDIERPRRGSHRTASCSRV